MNVERKTLAGFVIIIVLGISLLFSTTFSLFIGVQAQDGPKGQPEPQDRIPPFPHPSEIPFVKMSESFGKVIGVKPSIEGAFYAPEDTQDMSNTEIVSSRALGVLALAKLANSPFGTFFGQNRTLLTFVESLIEGEIQLKEGASLSTTSSGLFYISDFTGNNLVEANLNLWIILALLEVGYANHPNYIIQANNIFQALNSTLFVSSAPFGFHSSALLDNSDQIIPTSLSGMFQAEDMCLALLAMSKLAYFQTNQAGFDQYLRAIVKIDQTIQTSMIYPIMDPTRMSQFGLLLPDFNYTLGLPSQFSLYRARDSLLYLNFLIQKGVELAADDNNYDGNIMNGIVDPYNLTQAEQYGFQAIDLKSDIYAFFSENQELVTSTYNATQGFEGDGAIEYGAFAIDNFLATLALSEMADWFSSPSMASTNHNVRGGTIRSETYQLFFNIERNLYESFDIFGEKEFEEQSGGDGFVGFFNAFYDPFAGSGFGHNFESSLIVANSWAIIGASAIFPVRIEGNFLTDIPLAADQVQNVTLNLTTLPTQTLVFTGGYSGSNYTLNDIRVSLEIPETQTKKEIKIRELKRGNFSFTVANFTIQDPGTYFLYVDITHRQENFFSETDIEFEVLSTIRISLSFYPEDLYQGQQLNITIDATDNYYQPISEANVYAEVFPREKPHFFIGPQNLFEDGESNPVVVPRNATDADAFEVVIIVFKEGFYPGIKNMTLYPEPPPPFLVDIFDYVMFESEIGSLLGTGAAILAGGWKFNTAFIRKARGVRVTCPHCGGDAQSKYPVCQSCGNVLDAPSPSNLFDLRETFGEIFEGEDILD